MGTDMENRSAVVETMTWSQQNIDNGFSRHTYVPDDVESVLVAGSEAHGSENSVQSCSVEININNKANRDWSIFNKSYTAKMGARKYADDLDTQFIGYPENGFNWNFGTPAYIAAKAESDAGEQALNNTPDSAINNVMAVFTILASVSLLAY